MEKSVKPTVVDLFCGAGGLALGFSSAGFNLIDAREMNPAAVATYRARSRHTA